ncbi:MAG: hypothetical protein Kow006_07770 [Gammaproteobacteria bacterium]
MPRTIAALLGVALLVPLAAFGQEKRPADVETGQATAPLQAGRIARSQFTTRVVDREPVDRISELTAAENRIFYFTELLDMTGQTITHRWVYNGEVMAEVSFTVGGPRWRVWSSKSLLPDWSGDWAVSVVDENGEILGGNRFTYLPLRPN